MYFDKLTILINKDNLSQSDYYTTTAHTFEKGTIKLSGNFIIVNCSNKNETISKVFDLGKVYSYKVIV